jgi:hypothetical protein
MRQILIFLICLLATPLHAQQQTIDFNISSGVLGYQLSTSPTSLTGIPPTTYTIIFENPSSVDIYVCPAKDLKGNALTPGPNPGSTLVAPGYLVTFTGSGVISNTWLAAAATGSDIPFTLIASPNQ